MYKKFIISLFLLIFSHICLAQRQRPRYKYKTEYKPLSFQFGYNYNISGGDFAKRFGNTMSVGGGVEYVSLPKGWLIGSQYMWQFGSKVKEDPLAQLRDSDGKILSDIGEYADISMRQRGSLMALYGGKIFKIKDDGMRFSGIRVSVGGGWWQHRIRIADNQSNAPQVADYRQGYDRMSAGFLLTESIGYQIVSRNKTINVFFGLDFSQGFTRNRRGYQYDLRTSDAPLRFDNISGVRFAFAIPLWTKTNAEEIEY